MHAGHRLYPTSHFPTTGHLSTLKAEALVEKCFPASFTEEVTFSLNPQTLQDQGAQDQGLGGARWFQGVPLFSSIHCLPWVFSQSFPNRCVPSVCCSSPQISSKSWILPSATPPLRSSMLHPSSPSTVNLCVSQAFPYHNRILG